MLLQWLLFSLFALSPCPFRLPPEGRLPACPPGGRPHPHRHRRLEHCNLDGYAASPAPQQPPARTLTATSSRRLLPTACYEYLLPTTYYLLPTTYYLLPTTYYLLPTTYYLLPTTYYLLPATYYLLPTTYYLLPPTYYLLPATYHILPTT